MRRISVAVTALALAACAAATPAIAQYGGSPEDQIDEEPVEVGAGKEGYDLDQLDPGDVGDRRDALREHEDEADDNDVDKDDDRDDDRDQDVEGGAWRGEDGRIYCRRSDGTTGTIIGGGAGALIGRGIDTRGERGTGTIIGAVAGALLGRAIERGSRCR